LADGLKAVPFHAALEQSSVIANCFYMASLKHIWRWIYPNTDEHYWMPLMWLPFMVWFFVDPIWRHWGAVGWCINTAVGVFFVFLYLQVFSRAEPWKTISILGMLLIAIAATPLNSGAFSMLVYCAAAGSFTPHLRRVVPVVLVTGTVLIFYALTQHFPISYWGSMLLLIVLVSIGNHVGAVAHCQKEKLRQANHEIEHLAKVAERERIARDLHDVLGHTLSLITLKSELARKLVDRDPQRSKLEMQDVENTSRAALADVREAIRGYRSEGLFAELARARAALETAGVTLRASTVQVELSPAQESVLALALREAVTNVVRHAEAQKCEVVLSRHHQLCRLEIADDGLGCDGPEGNGLRGMRERLQAVGGSLERLTGKGTRLVIQLPLAGGAGI
jgi:two-component system sensor histidine kinase DesK